MTSHSAARLTGVLFIIATVADLLGAAVRPDLTGADYLGRATAQGDRVAAGALLLLIAAFACAGIAVSMYPILRKVNSGLALGAVVFRTIEAVMYVIAVVSLLSLVTLGQQFVSVGATGVAERASLGAVGELLLSLREHAAMAGVFAFCLGAFLYYCAFFQSRLIPRWLSGWGIAAVIMLTTAGVLALFNDDAVTSYVPLALPIFLQEMVLAVWLIAKGYRPSAVRSDDLSATRPTIASLDEHAPAAA